MVRLQQRELVGPMAWLSTRQIHTAAAWRTQRPLLDEHLCVGCMLCWEFCPEPAIVPSLERLLVTLQMDACKVCGVCAAVCPAHAITMVPEAA